MAVSKGDLIYEIQIMKCTDCKGSGSYQGLGPIETCSRCNGTGVEPGDTKLSGQRAQALVWDQAAATPREDFHAAKKKIEETHDDFGAPVDLVKRREAEARAEKNRIGQRAFQQKADAACDSLYNKFVIVVFKASENRLPSRGRIVSVDTFGPYIQKIELATGGQTHKFPMLEIEKILDEFGANQLWPTVDAPSSAPPPANAPPSPSTIVLAGTAVKTGDSVDVTTNNGMASARYVGVLKVINADTIEVEAQHGVDTIPIAVIDQLTVVTWAGLAAGFAKGGLVKPTGVQFIHDEFIIDVPAGKGDWMDKTAENLGVTRQELRAMSFAFAYGRPRGLGPASFPFMPKLVKPDSLTWAEAKVEGTRIAKADVARLHKRDV